MSELSYRLDRSIRIQASREIVFRFFTDSTRWAAWWGVGSTIDAQPGGTVYIRHPGGVETVGEVIEVSAPERIVFTYGFTSGKPMPPGSSRVTIRLEAEGAATKLHLMHEFEEEAPRDEHVQGWRYQLSVFANIVADEVNSGAAGLVDDWFGAWSDPDAGRREETFARIASAEVRFRDRFSHLDGLEDLVAHTGAAQRFMPGIKLERQGEVRHCQGTVLADWIWRLANGDERARGTNVFVLGADGRIESVTGLAETKN